MRQLWICSPTTQIDATAILEGDGTPVIVGDRCRIDAFVLAVVVKSLVIGEHVHIGPHCQINATGGDIFLELGVAIDGGCRLFTKSDDFLHLGKMGPTWDEKEHTITGDIWIGEHSEIGPNSVILPGVEIAPRTTVGALSLVNRSIEEEGYVWGGVPIRKLRKRI